MSQTDLAFLSIADLSALIRRKEVSPVEVVDNALQRFERLDGQLNSAITIMAKEARATALEAERAITAGHWRGPLHGVPIGLKDLIWTKGIRTTCASKIRSGFVPDTDATVCARLKQAGAVLLAKLNLHEFAYGATSTSPHFGRVCNPWNPTRLAGGSSGGSGAAVAAGLLYGAIGTDTGGSIRVPASLCGVAALKPTYGRISRYGVAPLSWSLDHVGPMTRTVKDSALLMNVLAGPDPLDETCSDLPVPDYTTRLNGDIKGLRIGVLTDLFDRVDPEVETAVRGAIKTMEEAGALIQPVTIPLWEHGVMAALLILQAEATAYHEANLRDRPGDYGEDVRLRLEQGVFVTALEYVKAQRLRSRLLADSKVLFEQVDVLVGPSTPIAAISPEEKEVTMGGQTEDPRSALTRTARFFNLLGLPVACVPCGFTASGLPIGLQIAGAPFDEATTLRVAYACELRGGWTSLRPPVS